MSPEQASLFRELVFDRQHARWAELNGSNGFSSAMMLRMLRRSSPPIEAVMLIEHPIVDEQTMLCEGKPLAAWRLNTFGLCEISLGTFDPMAWPSENWPFELVRFALDLGGSPVVHLNEMTAADTGKLMRCEVARTSQGLSLMVRRKRRYVAEPAPQAAPRQMDVSTEMALDFLRGNARTMTA